jgi:hypothetical protein
MAILKSIIQVNNGNTGWTKANVLDALETVFANMGWHGGSQITGSPVACEAPVTKNILSSGGWENAGGPYLFRRYNNTRYFYAYNNGTTSYSILEEWRITTNDVSVANNTIRLTPNTNHIPHSVQTGDALVYAPGSSTTSLNMGGVVVNTVYYAIRINDSEIKLAASLADANTETAIDITSVPNPVAIFRRQASASWVNPTLNIDNGDEVVFTVEDTTSGGDFYFIDTRVNSYSSDRVLNTNNFDGVSYKIFPSGMGVRDVNGFQTINWTVRGWQLSENESSNPFALTPDSGFDGTYSYGYANSLNGSMKGTINIVYRFPTFADYNSYGLYHKYTVPASGNRSELKLRIYRYHRDESSIPSIKYITINNIGSGWSNNDTFTIPGSAVGGVDGTNDIVFGINAAESSTGANNGVANIKVTNYGAGTEFYQKSSSGHFAVLKNVNNLSNKFGTTYYTFGMASDNSFRMYISSGCSWNTLNRLGTNYDFTNGGYEYGFFDGDRGLDYQESYNYISLNDGNFYYMEYASTSTPTAYPLSIRVYKAQSPQDSNFAIIQFTQTINGISVPFGTFSINKGPNYGSGIWDTDYVWNGGITRYSTSTRAVDIRYILPGYVNTYTTNTAVTEPSNTRSLARAAEYGYLRNSSSPYTMEARTIFVCNIDTNSDLFNYSNAVTYYRNSDYDSEPTASQICFSDKNRAVNSLANYYKPIKGIPIANQLIPCPYYIPDDFVMLQVATSPGLTEFRVGDTVTISPSEIYEIVLASYETNQNGLDNINNNNSIGMLFCARTT